MMRLAMMVVLVAVALTGCAGRPIWNSNGKMSDNSTQPHKFWDTNKKKSDSKRVFWDTNGKMQQGDRKIWDNAKGQPVIK